MMYDPFIITVFAVFSFAFGALIGSFLNVVIWRVPRGESIVSPPSHCPKCNTPIKWWCNIPILSWIALRGKCAKCKEPISFRYVLVELLCAALFLCAFWRYGYFAPLAWVWIALMIIGTFIDFDHQLLPDFVTEGGMIYGVLVSVSFWALDSFTGVKLVNITPEFFKIHPVDSLIGLVFGFGLLWLVRFFGTVAFKREAMGLGDVFLMGAIGAIFGWKAVMVTLILSSLFGSVVGVAMIALSKTRLGGFTAIPFGPYLCAGCVAWMFIGQEFLNWYISLLSGRPVQ